MTGKELIIYILEHELEDSRIFHNGRFLDFMTIEETAAKFKVGVETVKAWYRLSLLQGFEIGNTIFFPKDVCDPREIKTYE